MVVFLNSLYVDQCSVTDHFGATIVAHFIHSISLLSLPQLVFILGFLHLFPFYKICIKINQNDPHESSLSTSDQFSGFCNFFLFK